MKKWLVALLLLFVILAVETVALQPALPYLITLLLLVFIASMVVEIAPARIESKMNRTLPQPAEPISPEAVELHKKLFVVDLHADALMWNRDLLRRYNYGHVDVPRMVEGNQAFQVFGVVTKSPRGQNFQNNAAKSSDNITLLAILQAWPIRTWRSLFQRALYQAQKLENFARRSGGKLIFVRNVQDLDRLVDAHAKDSTVVGGFPMLEGAHALEGKLENVDKLYKAGFRVIGMAHFFDNEVSGSAHGAEKSGLSPLGFEVVKRAQELNMIIDLAHASPTTVDQILSFTKVPVIASHTGVCGTKDSPRNLTDERIRGIAATGGVMGIAVFDEAVGEATIEAAVRAMRYVADLVGVDYVAVGGDLDGTVTSPIDASGMPRFTDALLKAGFSPEDIAKIMGQNALRVFRAVLPKA